MRIRKREVPFSLSSLSSLPLSDPHLSRSPVVQLQLNHYPHPILSQEDDTAEYFNPPSSSDQQNQPIGVGSSSRHPEYFISNQDTKDCPKDERGREVGEGERSKDTRGRSFLGAKTDSLHERSNSLQQVGRWCEGKKAFPLKRRRGNFERKSNEETSVEKDKKMKTKMNKKCLQRNGNNQEVEQGNYKEIKESGGVNANGGGTAKKKGRGGALMEGSRCSRVNGRGWRCCQQTLVGYSLCEHHLGKGRLRSMTSVRSSSMSTTITTTNKAAVSSILPLSSSEEEDKQQMRQVLPDNKLLDEGDHEKKPLSKRKTKLGIVKARSISSLLGQESNAIAIAEKKLAH